MNHKVTVRHPEGRTDFTRLGTKVSEMWVAVCECGWFTDYLEPSEYSRARALGDQHERLFSLPPEVRSDVQQHAFTVVKGTDVAGKTVGARGACGAIGCGWEGPEHRGEGCTEKANADCSAHLAAELDKALTAAAPPK